jgi:hypothetical protein
MHRLRREAGLGDLRAGRVDLGAERRVAEPRYFVASPRFSSELGMPSEPPGAVLSVAYQASASVPAAPPCAQSNSFVTARPLLTRTGADQLLPSSVEKA